MTIGEVIEIKYDPNVVTYRVLLEVFFATHNPTTPGQQGNDIGPQYQSAVFVQDDEQHRLAQEAIATVDASGKYAAKVCTELRASAKFWPAEAMHDNYFALHPKQGYCEFVIAPKVAKFKQQFAAKLK